MAKKAADDDSLKRLGGGRWQTRDERFTIEPESGTWVVLDAEQTDDLGLPLVRGPFGSLTAAKAAIAGARGSEPVVSPLAAKVAEHQGRPVTPAKALKPHVIEVVKAGTTLGTPAKPPAASKPPVAKAKPSARRAEMDPGSGACRTAPGLRADRTPCAGRRPGSGVDRRARDRRR